MEDTEKIIYRIVIQVMKSDQLYPFKNREDLCEGRTTWEELKDTSDMLYSAIREIHNILKLKNHEQASQNP